MNDTDAELMERLAAGDDTALNVLMARWSDRVIAFLFRMTGQREVAVDLAQETFVKLYQARARYRPQGSFSTYLFAIAANLARNHSRWRRRHPAVSLDELDAESSSVRPEPADPGHTPADSAIAREKAEEVHRAVRALPDDLREALVLSVHDGLGYAEIARISGCSAKAAETRIYRARQILKERLKDIF